MAEGRDPVAALEAQLAQLRGQFLQRLEGTLEHLGTQLGATDTPPSPEVLQETHAELHRLAGTGGTFGFHELSQQARRLEVQAKAWLGADASIAPAEWATWKAAVLALSHTVAAAEPAAGGLADQVWVGIAKGLEDQPQVLLVHSDRHLGDDLRRGLSQFGYDVVYCHDLAQARQRIEARTPDLLVLQLDDEAGNSPGAGLVATLPRGRRVPLLYLAAHGGVALQLAAAHAGADDFLPLPVDAPTVAAHIERLLGMVRQPPFRVLVVDDDAMEAERCQLTLQAAGMTAERLSEPREVMATLQRFRPDVLLMDLYMPQHGGAELARAIRYDAQWQGLPILFLSAESDLDLQYQALDSGGDDFLVKPVADARLVAAVRARALRARRVEELMTRDSLTGLLTHASIKERLAQELDRASRQRKPLAVAMVDIDFFKRINDSWGHPVGDQVIKTLGHLLRQRLRRQDSVGRYGGEEFLVILPECTAADARRVLNDIRLRFAAVSFQHQGHSFSVTLSAGISSSESVLSASELLANADALLYRAKQDGRNQVLPAAV